MTEFHLVEVCSQDSLRLQGTRSRRRGNSSSQLLLFLIQLRDLAYGGQCHPHTESILFPSFLWISPHRHSQRHASLTPQAFLNLTKLSMVVSKAETQEGSMAIHRQESRNYVQARQKRATGRLENTKDPHTFAYGCDSLSHFQLEPVFLRDTQEVVVRNEYLKENDL